jgi:anti-anti-sigma factor
MPRKLHETYHKIGELLVRRKMAPLEAIDAALAHQRSEMEQKRTPRRLGEILVDQKVLTKRDIREILEAQRIGRGEKRILRIALRDADGIAVVALQGRVDETKEEAITRVFERLMNRGFCRIAVDCRNLHYLNSHGISSFVSYIDEARARGGDMKFFGLGSEPAIVIQRLGLAQFVQSFATEGDATAAFALPIDEYMSRGALAEYVSAEASRFFHLSYCPAAQKIADADRLYYESKWHAREANKLACKRCKP